MLITGTNGIGKTSLAGMIVHQMITNDALEQLVWIDAPGSVQYVRQYLQQELLGASDLSLRQWSMLYPTALVLDSIEALLDNIADLQALLVDLAEARVFMTNRYYVEISPDLTHVALGSIDRDAAEQLIRELRRQHPESTLQAFASILYDRVGAILG